MWGTAVTFERRAPERVVAARAPRRLLVWPTDSGTMCLHHGASLGVKEGGRKMPGLSSDHSDRDFSCMTAHHAQHSRAARSDWIFCSEEQKFRSYLYTREADATTATRAEKTLKTLIPGTSRRDWKEGT